MKWTTPRGGTSSTGRSGRRTTTVWPSSQSRSSPRPRPTRATWPGSPRGLLEEEKVEQRQFRLKKLAKTFFGKGLRDALMAPEGLTSSAAPDELNPGRRKLTLGFELPKGSYATILLKRLFHEPLPPDEDDAD